MNTAETAQPEAGFTTVAVTADPHWVARDIVMLARRASTHEDIDGVIELAAGYMRRLAVAEIANKDLLAACKSALRLRGAANQEGEHYATKDHKPVKLHAICEGIEETIRAAIAKAGGGA